MHVIITNPSSGEVLLQRLLNPGELMDARSIADAYAEANGSQVDVCENGCECYIPTCCGDINVTFAEEPSSFRCWSSTSFYLTNQEF